MLPTSGLTAPSPSSQVPLVVVKTAAAERLRRGGLTLRHDELKSPAGPSLVGAAVRLADERGRPLGTGLGAAPGPTPLAIRLFDRDDVLLDDAELGRRLQQAAELRAALFRSDSDADRADAKAATGSGTAPLRRDAYRLVHGEADGLPGLFIDRYGDAAVVQTATAAMDARKGHIAALLRRHLGVTWVVCRDDGSARDVESLPRERGILLDERTATAVNAARGGAAALDRAAVSTLASFHDAGSQMQADLLHDRKTGSFLDQQDNHARAADYAERLFPRRPGRAATALDAFSYHGGFALALARSGLSVTACDEDADAVARARRNAALNRVSVDFRVENAFDLLRRLEAQGTHFDVVVVDPPALAKRGRDRSSSPAGASTRPNERGGAGPRDENSPWARAYRELNLRAIRLLSPGGLLVSCSCSGRVSPALFGELLQGAAADARRSLQLLERHGAGADHPVLVNFPESEYLKCWFLRALD
ncbi:MAG TPA: methyltransferase domain-containing protein [Pseudomonadota bacterium]|nr:methyltransferase domain-containing protein [Pseudomonadota bacterium]